MLRALMNSAQRIISQLTKGPFARRSPVQGDGGKEHRMINASSGKRGSELALSLSKG